MEMETVVSLISSVGFPIVCCFFMWRYINTTLKDFTATMSENTKMISKLCDRLEQSFHGKDGNDE
jgi:hypothetical protein